MPSTKSSVTVLRTTSNSAATWQAHSSGRPTRIHSQGSTMVCMSTSLTSLHRYARRNQGASTARAAGDSSGASTLSRRHGGSVPGAGRRCCDERIVRNRGAAVDSVAGGGASGAAHQVADMGGRRCVGARTAGTPGARCP